MMGMSTVTSQQRDWIDGLEDRKTVYQRHGEEVFQEGRVSSRTKCCSQVTEVRSGIRGTNSRVIL